MHPSVGESGDLAITNVSVLPMSSEGALAHQTVLIRGGRIASVAPSASVALADGITRVDGTGKWLLPGLADMHVHTWSEDDLTMFVAAGVTTIRNMWGVKQHLAWRAQIARGERLGPTIVTAGDLIDGDPPDWPGSVVLGDPADADRLVAAQKAAGYDFLKPVARLSPEAYRALAAAGQRHGMPLSGHVSYAVGLEGALAARQRSIEHLDGYVAALVPPGVSIPSIDDPYAWIRAVLAGRDLSRLPRLVQRTIAAGTWNCPTLIVYDRTPELHDAAASQKRAPWLDLVPAAVRARWVRDYQAQGFTAEDSANVRVLYAEVAAIARALAAAGAPLLVGTDTGVPFIVPGESMHDEIELLVAAGVPRPQVLRAATADAWRYLGRPREAGVVEVGARADLLLVSTDPRTQPLPLVPDGVVIRGKWLPRTELEARLAEVRAHAAPPGDPWIDAPQLAPGGAADERYDMAIGDTVVGQERLAIGVDGGARRIAGQIADFAARTETSYTLGPDTATVTSTYHTMTVSLTGAITDGKLVVTGTDLTGRAVSLSEKVPAGVFLSAPGIGGSIPLAETLAGMKPGTRRTATSVAIGYFPAIGVVSTRYEVQRLPDRGGQRVFAVAATKGGATVSGELVLDDAGGVAAQTFGPPIAMSIRRRPR